MSERTTPHRSGARRSAPHRSLPLRSLPHRSLPRRVADRIRRLTLAVNVWLFTANAWVYAAAGSFIGFETVALWLSFITLWPVAVPVMLAGIAVVGVVVRRIRARRGARR